MCKMQREQIKSLEVRQEPTDSFNRHVDAWMKNSVWATGCRSWYKMGTVDGKAWLWPGGVRHKHTLQLSGHHANSYHEDIVVSQDYKTAAVRGLQYQIQESQPMDLVGCFHPLYIHQLTLD